MKRDALEDAMARRSPLGPRDSVAPVDLYRPATKPTADERLHNSVESPKVNNRTNKDVDESASPLADTAASQSPSAAETSRRRYTTYLKPETIKAIKWLAVDGERNDYEIVQEALDTYLRSHDRWTAT
jgi:hypothetical protein